MAGSTSPSTPSPEHRSDPAVRQFLDALRVDGGAAAPTLDAYRRDLRQFLATLPTDADIHAIHREDVERFISALARDTKASSVARKLSALRQFFKFCCRELGLAQNPCERIESPRQGTRLPKALSLEQTTRLLEAAQTGLPYAGPSADALRARDCAMLYLLYATGLRASELVGLTLHNLDLEQGYCRVKGKGNKERIAPFADLAGAQLSTYLKVRATLAPGLDESAVFLRASGKAISRQELWVMIKGLGAMAAIAPKAISPHVLRHSFATHLMQSGLNLRSLQLLLGHADLSTTQIYAHVTPEHLKTTHRKYHPRGGG